MQWISPFVLNSVTPFQRKAIFSWLFDMNSFQTQHYWWLLYLIFTHADIAKVKGVSWKLLLYVHLNCFPEGGLQTEIKIY